MADEAPHTAEPSRRRRRRATAAQGAPPAPVRQEPVAEPVEKPRKPRRPKTPKPAPDTTEAPRRRRPTRDAGLRDLVGAGPSQVGVSGALRARDVNRPTDDDLAEAEQTVTIVRRNWNPDQASKR